MSSSVETHQAYESYRNLVANQEQEFGAIVNFFQEKLALEQNYGKENEKLNKRYAFLTVPNSKSSFACMTSLQDLLNVQNFEHSRLRLNLQQTLQELTELKKNEDLAIKSMKETVKPIAKHYAELLTVSVPKAKQNFFKKAEMEKEKEREKNEPGVSSQKVYKISKDIDAMEHIYRSTIVLLEETRSELSIVKTKAAQEYVEIERVRSEILKKTFDQLAALMQSSHKTVGDQLDKFSFSAAKIDAEEDKKIASDYFKLHWPEYETTFAESFKTRAALKDMVFGVPLSYGIRNTPSKIPPILTKCFDAIEARGLDVEGLYRVSPKKAELLDLKIQVETDVNSVDFHAPELDIHLLTGLIKTYLRDLPTPLLVFPPRERVEYSSNPNQEERLLKLGGRLQTLPREKFAVLKALMDHLQKLSSHSGQNKMSNSNLAMVFSGVLFQNQSDQPLEPVKANWFPSKQQPAATDLSSLDFLKLDLVMEDMLNHSASLFTLFSKDSNRQGLSSAFAGNGPTVMKAENRSKSEEKIEKIENALPPAAKLSFGSLFGSKNNLAKKSNSELSKSQELTSPEGPIKNSQEKLETLPEVEANSKGGSENIGRQATRKSLAPALPQRISETILLTDTLEAYKTEEELVKTGVNNPISSPAQYPLTSKPSLKKTSEAVPITVEDMSGASQSSFQSAQSASSQVFADENI